MTQNKHIDILHTVTASLMLLLFLGYYIDVNFFAHAHIVNGVTLVHSHVHNCHHHDTDAGGHTPSECAIITDLAFHLISTGEHFLVEPDVFFMLLQTFGIKFDAQISGICHMVFGLRAPPALIA